MKPPVTPKIDSAPIIAKWELWTVAQMLVSTRGDDAEAHAQARLTEAQANGDEAGEIVWAGVFTQLRRIREGEMTGLPNTVLMRLGVCAHASGGNR